MNLLIVRPEALSPDNTIRISGERALHIAAVLHGKPGDRIRAGLPEGRTGSVELLKVSREEVIAGNGSFTEDPPGKLPLTLAVALPRPHSFRKTLHFAVSSGIRRIVFFHSARVEKSYWNSTALRPEELEEEMILGLEQGFDTRKPELLFFRTFRAFLEWSGTLPGFVEKIAAHPVKGEQPELRTGGEMLLAIGPEGGFIPQEVELLGKNGFKTAGFGSHILRVEFASAFITGALLGASFRKKEDPI